MSHVRHPQGGAGLWRSLRADQPSTTCDRASWDPNSARRSLLGCRDQAKSSEQAGSKGSSRPGLRGPRPRNQDEGQSQSGSHCILLENIDIYFSSQLELNTILPGLKKQNKTKTQTLRNVHSFLPTCPFPQLLAGSPLCPSLPARPPGGWVSEGG